MPHTYQIIDDDDFDPQDDLRPEYDFAALHKADRTSLESFESKVQAVCEAMCDPQFLQDLKQVAEDFKHVDDEGVE